MGSRVRNSRDCPESKPFEIVSPGSVAVPKGFRVVGVECGLKAEGRDLALIYSETKATAAATYTRNRVAAASIKVTRKHLSDGTARAVVVNSGNANACNGEKGVEDALSMATQVADELSISPCDVIVASTGVIGRPLPVEKVRSGIHEAASLLKKGKNDPGSAAEAIMTTDTFPKELAVKVKLSQDTISIRGIAKGAGMIAPDMATMLAFLTTDARIGSDHLRAALVDAVSGSFNAITVDGDTSTNDMVAILANGASMEHPIAPDGEDFNRFCSALSYVCKELALMIVKDGEGATKLLKIEVSGAASSDDAKKVAMTIANSSLFKTAMFGQDPNWGRIAAATGRSGADVDESRMRISIGGIVLFENGVGLSFDYERLKEILSGKQVYISVDLGLGEGAVEVYTCDLSYDYIRINASYTT